LLNEIFGEMNFAGEIVWKNSSKNDQSYISMQHEYLLVYVKDKSSNPGNWTERKGGLEDIYAAFDGFRSQYGNDWKAIHKAALDWYKQFPPSSPIYGNKHYSWMDERGVYFPDNISGPNAGQYVYDVIHPTTGKTCKMPSSGWRYPQPEMERRIAEGLVHFGDDETTVPNNKTYLSNTEQQSLTSMLFQDGRSASKRLERLFGTKVFSNPKDETVLARLFAAFDVADGDIVLDFFSGSGTTGDAVEQYCKETGRQVSWILVQLPEDLKDNLRTASGSNKTITKNAIKYLETLGQPAFLTNLAEERLRLDRKRIIEDGAVNDSGQSGLFDSESKPVDAGFRVFTLDESGIIQPEQGQLLINRIKPDRSDEDIIFEMMLKWGLELTYPIERTDIGGYPCYSVAGDALVCCMEPGLTIGVIEAIAALEPERVFMLDSILDDSLKLNALQIFKRVEDRTQKHIDLRTV
ncbi:MAG: DNA methyltransferase, partial [Raoultibacter sp.]